MSPNPLRTVRNEIRAQFFEVLRKAFATFDGRQIVAKTQEGLRRDRPAGVELSNRATPYRELPSAARVEWPALRDDILFVTGRFRSGSTLMWNLFRHLEDFTAYYEPFNERRWFDRAARGDRVDATHRGVTDYWREYDGLEELGEWYRAEWTTSRLYLEADAWMPEMKRFLEILIARAPGRPVLQLNRLDFRLPWVRENFPAARILHLVRHPRDQWCSTLMKPEAFPSSAKMSEFEPHDHFYLMHWVRDLSFHFPFLAPERVDHPYELFYFVWKLSYLFGQEYADHSLRFEALVQDPRDELTAAFDALDIARDRVDALVPLVESASLGKWKGYASEEWFRSREEKCERILDEFLGGDGPSPS